MKRGQVTVFVIIGIVLLILVALFLFRESLFGTRNTLSEESVAPVEQLILNCNELSLEHLLRQMGKNGGLLDTSHLRHHPLVWDSDTVSFPPQDVPYWSHVRPCPDNALGCEASAQPALCEQGQPCPLNQDTRFIDESVQGQLEAALPGKIAECLDDFNAVSDQFVVEQRGRSSAEVAITDDKVIALFRFKVLITDIESGNSAVIEDFTSTADLDLPSLYGLANDLANDEREHAYLERLALHLLAVYGGIDSEIPPMRAVEIFGKKNYWVRSEVERLLKDEVLIWLNFIQVPNALAGFVPIWPSEEGLSQDEQFLYAGIFKYLNVKPNEETYPEYKVRFLYPYTRPFLSINGGQEILGPRSASTGSFFEKLTGVFMNDYRFRYDLAFPVLVTITDEAAFDGEGYEWTFALEGNIRRNAPLNRSATTSSFRVSQANVDPLSPFQRVPKTITVQLTDAKNNLPLENARITYECGESYYIGETDVDGVLSTWFPYCRYGGVLRYSKEGYLGSGVAYDNYRRGDEERFAFSLWPLQEVTFAIEKGSALSFGELGPYDSVMLGVARVKDSPYDEDVPLGGFYTLAVANQTREAHDPSAVLNTFTESYPPLLNQSQIDTWTGSMNETRQFVTVQPTVTVAIAPGAYTVEAYLINSEPFSIPEKREEYCVDPLGLSCDTIIYPQQNFSVWMTGGAEINASAPFDVEPDALYRFSSLTFRVLEEPVPRTWDALEEYKGPEGFKGQRSAVLPRWG